MSFVTIDIHNVILLVCVTDRDDGRRLPHTLIYVVCFDAYFIALQVICRAFCFPKFMKKNLRINQDENDYSSNNVWSKKKFARIVSEEIKNEKKLINLDSETTLNF